ncbi:MAG: NifU family protein [Alphaproteobacteria bacterium]
MPAAMGNGASASTPSALRDTVERVIACQIQPLLMVHGGGVVLVEVTSRGEVMLEFVGSCRGCCLKSVTYALGIRQKLLPIPGVSAVTVEGVRLSDQAVQRAEALYGRHAPWVRAAGSES